MAGMVVQHNMNALGAYNKLNTNVAGLKKSSEKLSSGYRINRAGDDAAGLAISEKMRSQIRGLNQAKRNAQDGISMIQTYEGALQETHSILQRMKELAAESANGTYDDATDRAAIQLEFDQLNDELNQIADTDFNGVVALNGGMMSDGNTAVSGAIIYPPTNQIKLIGSSSAGHTVKVTNQDANAGAYTYQTNIGGIQGLNSWVSNGATVNSLPFSITDADGNAVTTFTNGYTVTLSSVASGDGVSVPNAYKEAEGDLTYVDSLTLQVGARTKDAVDFTFEYEAGSGMGTLAADLDVSSRGLGTGGLVLTDQESANTAIDKIDFAINKVSMVRATFGSVQNRLEHKIENLTTTAENMTEAESTIRDTDMASEMMNYTKYSILQQAAQSMLAQANAQPQGILQLLG